MTPELKPCDDQVVVCELLMKPVWGCGEIGWLAGELTAWDGQAGQLGVGDDGPCSTEVEDQSDAS